MYRQNFQYLLLITVFYVKAAEIIKGPQNTAVTKGENVTLECWVEITREHDIVVWNKYKSKESWLNYDPTVTKVFQNEPLFIKDEYDYVIDTHPRYRRYQLIIRNASQTHAGMYACVLEKENTTQEAALMVVDPLRCTPGRREIEIDVGQTVTFKCQIRSFGKYSPRLYMWRPNTQGNSSTSQLPASRFFGYQTEVIATTALDGKAYVCGVSFDYLADEDEPFNKQQFVGNVPSYYDQCGIVLHVNKQILRILHNSEAVKWGVTEVELNDSIRCSSIPRNIRKVWLTKDNDTEVIDGEEITIEERHFGMNTYTCHVEFIPVDHEIVHKTFTFYLPADTPKDMQILRNMRIVKQVFDVELGDNITCTARGRPEPMFWFSNNYNKTDVTDGNEMRIEERHVARSQTSYTCYAQNSDGIKVNKISKTFWINGGRERRPPLVPISAGYQDVSSTLSIIIVASITLLLQL